MKKQLLALLMMVCTLPTLAQMNSGGFSVEKNNLYYGMRMGMTVATLKGNFDSLDGKVGMTLGGVVGLRVSNANPLFIESGLYYTQRGGKKDKTEVTLHYIELPVLVKYGFRATEGLSILPYFGPYFSMGVSGTTKIGDKKVNAFNNEIGELKRPDMGFKLGCGAEYNKIYCEIGYQFGVANLAKEDNATCRGNAFIANFGINF